MLILQYTVLLIYYYLIGKIRGFSKVYIRVHGQLAVNIENLSTFDVINTNSG